MRLLVVANSPPLSVRRVSPYCSTAPQPPGPGLPLQAPSVWIVTVLAMRNESFMSTFYRPCPPRHSEKMILRRHDHSHPITASDPSLSHFGDRPDERRVGKECVCTCRSR